MHALLIKQIASYSYLFAAFALLSLSAIDTQAQY
jgi:hypothetical protein